jgi:ATP-dependent DNA helicase RecG
MYTENANRAEGYGVILPENLEPNSKNPIVASFMRNIWMADELGSGTRRLHRYVPLYSGKPPEMLEGDIFKIIVPLDDSYSFDAKIGDAIKAQNKAQVNDGDCTINCALIMDYLRTNPKATQKEVAEAIGKSRRTVQDAIKELREKGLLDRDGAKKNGRWIVK